MKTKTKKLLSLLLAVMMMLSVVPFYASAAETLTYSNVETWPTVTYKNPDGKMHFGQTLEQALIINDDEVVKDANGNIVEGHFEFSDPSKISSAGTSVKEAVVFVSDDSNYSDFNVTKLRCKIYFAVETTIAVPVDENDTVPVATEVEPGAQLRTSTLSGAKYTNPYNAEEPKIIARSWEWTFPNTVVNESGYYEALFYPANYERITKWVLVRVKGDTSEVKIGTSIEELPTVSDVKYGDKSSSIELTGGKAVDMNGEQVSGTFSWERDFTCTLVGVNIGTVKFTPDDERYASSTYPLTFTVEKAPIKFVDENGKETVPVVTVPYGTKIDYQFISAYLKDLKTNAESINIDFSGAGGSGNLEGWNTWPAVGEHEFTVRLTSYNSNYAESFAKFKLVVEPRAISVTSVSYISNGELIRIETDYSSAPGTYDVYVDGSLVGSALEYGSYGVDCSWKPEASGTYNVKVVYNPAENDSSDMEDYETEITVAVARNITIGDGLSATMKINGSEYNRNAKYGDEITVSVLDSMLSVLAGWEIKDTAGNIVDLGLTAEQLKAQEITFTMPDYDIVVTAKSNIEEENPDDNTDDNGGLDIDNIFGDLTEGDSDNAILNIFNNIIAWFKNIIETIKGFFRAIGDAT